MYGIDYQLAAQVTKTVTLSSSGSSYPVEIESKIHRRRVSQKEVPLVLKDPRSSQPKRRQFYGTTNIEHQHIVLTLKIQHTCKIRKN